ncbi:(-)-germacrene D synthase-like [Ziziphus jujuba]|uniref:(-)-germacrene D synthase-like n=1 Tax=Ziziphus jujuba TaxID=326968 RepID=A0A6P6FYH2_ZIZJJ|nr:(-)-germacrene D synthase-like [Ziziphus jujuba]
MLSLYEAAHLRLHGEEVLDEAISFTITHLRHSLMEIGHTSPHLSEKVMWALNRPVHKTIPMLESRHYISIYPKEDSHNKTLLKLAELDFNLLQALHQKELNSIARWWKNLDFARKFPYARDRVIELYFWILAMYFEPEYIHVREFVTKSVTMISIIDDTYDVHGTYEEIKLFTQAIKRWDISAKDSLPDYMQLIYEAILDVYDEIEEHNAKEGRSYRAHYAKETMKEAVQAYFDEASWFYDEYIPTLEDYMSIMDVSCAYPFIIKTSFLGVGEIATKEVFDWAFDKPKIIKATSAIGRIMNDIVSHKFEQKRGHAASSVECYMKQHGVQEEEAYKMLRQKIEDAWKDINQELLKSTFVPTVLLGPILNLNRVSEFIYRDDDCYTKAHKIKDDLALLLVHPVSTLHQDVQP